MKFGNWKVRENYYITPKLRWLPMVRSLLLFFTLISVAVYGLAARNIPVNLAPKDTPVLAQSKENIDKINLINLLVKYLKTDNFSYEGIIKSELPLWNKVKEQNNSNSTRAIINRAMYSVTQMEITKPDTYLKAEIPMMSLISGFKPMSTDKTINATPKVNSTEEYKVAVPLSNDVQVAIYNTHTSETYDPTGAVTHIKGSRGGVYLAAEELKKVLEEKHGLRTINSDKIHDGSNFNFAYGASLETAQQLVAQNKNLKLLIDLHRDGAYSDKSVTTTKINGQDTARIYLIMGTDGNLPYPNWQKNKAFAEKINAQMNAMYPGLSRGVKQDIYRYNQQVHDHAILIEVGGVQNSQAEANRAVALLADVLAAVINENK